MLRTLSSGAGPVTAPGAARTVSASVMCALSSAGEPRHARACPGHPRFLSLAISRTWTARTSPAMTSTESALPPKPFRLARQLDGLDLLELDDSLGHEIVDIAIGRAGDLPAI